MISLKDAESFNPVAFVLNNRIVNENQSPIEFKSHYFMVKPYLDMSPRQVIMKCSQIGWSTLAIIKSLWLASYEKANIIYTMPSRNSSKEFVVPKVDPIIEANPVFKSWMGSTENHQLKSVKDRFIYYRGSWDPSSAISISAHILINDEVDRSNQKSLRTYQTRLDDARRERPDLGYVWEFSNPSIPGFGVDERFQHSDQKHWFVKCRHCSFEWYLRFPENVDMDRKIYICSKCREPLTDEDRRTGRWVNKKESDVSGYWLSQLMVPWIPAKKIIEESYGDQQVFYNFTLGLPYITKDQTVSRAALLKCISPDVNPQVDNAIGVDNGVVKHYVIGNQYGIFRVGKTESWEEIEQMRNRYAATMVIDANPYPKTPTELVRKYPGKVFMQYYVQDRKQLGIVRFLEGDRRGTVESDRTKIIDAVVADINAGDVEYNMTITELEEYLSHWANMYRVIEVNSMGIPVPKWEHIEGRPDHFAHAHIYFKEALMMAGVKGGIVRMNTDKKTEYMKSRERPTALPDSSIENVIDLKEIARLSTMKQGQDWKTR